MPEFAVVMAYAKSAIFADLMTSDLAEDPYCLKELELYFPAALRERHLEQLARHRLRREIILMRITNNMVNRSGTTFVFRLAEETGCSTADVTRAHLAAWEMFGMPGLWSEIEGLGSKVAGPVQVELFLEARKLVERASRWLLGHRRHPLDIAATVADFVGGLAQLADHLPRLVGPAEKAWQEEATNRYMQAGVPEPLARRVADLPELFAGLD